MIFTDDTAACKLIDQPIRLVSSVAPNPKVTVPGDLPFVETLLKGKSGRLNQSESRMGCQNLLCPVAICGRVCGCL